jgi:hypothetical protein
VKCEECTSLLEDHLYNQLGAADEERLTDHLSVCSECAGEYVQLRREQELYASCELQLAPEFWASVQARIQKENGPRVSDFAGLFNFRFDQVAAVVTCLLVVAGLIGLWRYFEMGRNRAPSEVNNAPQISTLATAEKSNAASVADSGKSQGALVDDVKINTPHSRAIFPRPVKLSRTFRRKIEKPLFAANVVVERDPMSLAQRSVPRDLDIISARHLEQIQMLLRSFENGRFLAHSKTLDLTYEIGLSRNLLARNVLVRGDAELAGNLPLTRLLDRSEPFLLDIANLRNNSDQKEIRLVKESLTKAQIVAALQAF